MRTSMSGRSKRAVAVGTLATAMAGGGLFGMASAASADAAPAADYTVGRGVATDSAANYVRAFGTITDHTSGNDSVAVQTYIQVLLDVGSWSTVATGPRVTGNNTATSAVSPRRCTNGKSYRAKVNTNWNGQQRTSYSGSRVC
ncbi:hypothetical protein E1281_19980 [Actinomadura sp. KC345]|uniref:hypothetical protein n=1 Tax=Actinomadura sp. KC345 TaxID=2530371 RepID=UPI0010503B24|nr:hypothetical protein [Actinomadura sp. KC345]TDC51693.1 hypothetical protein E1281_19980 [Actinomadura sp. KC345]